MPKLPNLLTAYLSVFNTIKNIYFLTVLDPLLEVFLTIKFPLVSSLMHIGFSNYFHFSLLTMLGYLLICNTTCFYLVQITSSRITVLAKLTSLFCTSH